MNGYIQIQDTSLAENVLWYYFIYFVDLNFDLALFMHKALKPVCSLLVIYLFIFLFRMFGVELINKKFGGFYKKNFFPENRYFYFFHDYTDYSFYFQLFFYGFLLQPLLKFHTNKVCHIRSGAKHLQFENLVSLFSYRS